MKKGCDRQKSVLPGIDDVTDLGYGDEYDDLLDLIEELEDATEQPL